MRDVQLLQNQCSKTSFASVPSGKWSSCSCQEGLYRLRSALAMAVRAGSAEWDRMEIAGVFGKMAKWKGFESRNLAPL